MWVSIVQKGDGGQRRGTTSISSGWERSFLRNRGIINMKCIFQVHPQTRRRRQNRNETEKAKQKQKQKPKQSREKKETLNGRHWFALDLGTWHVNELEKAMVMMKLHLMRLKWKKGNERFEVEDWNGLQIKVHESKQLIAKLQRERRRDKEGKSGFFHECSSKFSRDRFVLKINFYICNWDWPCTLLIFLVFVSFSFAAVFYLLLFFNPMDGL